MCDGAVGARLEQQRLDPVERAVDAVLVRRAAGPPHEGVHPSVRRDECQIGLCVAAVDREDEPAHSTASATSESSSPSTSSSWPISGCTSNALRAVAVSRVTAASAVKRS